MSSVIILIKARCSFYQAVCHEAAIFPPADNSYRAFTIKAETKAVRNTSGAADGIYPVFIAENFTGKFSLRISLQKAYPHHALYLKIPVAVIRSYPSFLHDALEEKRADRLSRIDEYRITSAHSPSLLPLYRIGVIKGMDDIEI